MTTYYWLAMGVCWIYLLWRKPTAGYSVPDIYLQFTYFVLAAFWPVVLAAVAYSYLFGGEQE